MASYKGSSKPRKQERNPDQLPLITPESSWVPPTELPDWRNRGAIAFDTETMDDGIANDRGAGWAYKQGYIAGVSMAVEGQSVYVPINHPDSPNFDEDAVRRWVDDHLQSGAHIVTQNGGYDYGWIGTQWGLKPPPDEKIQDLQAAAYIVDENRLSYGMDSIAAWQGIQGKDTRLLKEAVAAYGGDPKKPSAWLWRLPARYGGIYAAQDAVTTLEGWLKLMNTVKEENTLNAYRTECELIPMIVAMRRRGVRIDTEEALWSQKVLFQKRDAILDEMTRRLAHKGLNLTMEHLNSWQHMRRIFDMEGLKYPTTEKGQPSFKNAEMEKRDHWFPQMAVKASKYHEAANKFLGGYILPFTHKGRIHAEIHQFKTDDGGTESHRFAYSNPPLQQMPSRNPELMSIIRGAFLPEQGELWGAHDFGQQEYRLIVHFAALMNLGKADMAVQKYINDPKTDFHSLVAEMTGLDRKPAKDTNFAKAFGAGVKRFAWMTNKSLEEAKQIMDQYDEELPFVKDLGDACKRMANRRGYIRMIDGARKHYDKWEPVYRDEDAQYIAPKTWDEAQETWPGERLKRAFTHKAMNNLIQGSAARQTKIAMKLCWKEGIIPLIQVHDELDCSHGSHAEGKRVAEIMKHAVELVMPMAVDSEFGPSWGKAAANKETGYRATWGEACALSGLTLP